MLNILAQSITKIYGLGFTPASKRQVLVCLLPKKSCTHAGKAMQLAVVFLDVQHGPTFR